MSDLKENSIPSQKDELEESFDFIAIALEEAMESLDKARERFISLQDELLTPPTPPVNESMEEV